MDFLLDELAKSPAYPVTISPESTQLILRAYIGDTIHSDDNVRLAVRESQHCDPANTEGPALNPLLRQGDVALKRCTPKQRYSEARAGFPSWLSHFISLSVSNGPASIARNTDEWAFYPVGDRFRPCTETVFAGRPTGALIYNGLLNIGADLIDDMRERGELAEAGDNQWSPELRGTKLTSPILASMIAGRPNGIRFGTAARSPSSIRRSATVSHPGNSGRACLQ